MLEYTAELPEGHKRCTKCGEIKPATAEYFHRDRTKGSGLRAECKQCMNYHQRCYYKAHTDELKERNRYWRRANPDKKRSGDRRRYKENPEKARQRHRRHYLAHSDKVKEKVSRYNKSNPQKVREISRRRRTEKLALPYSFTLADEQIALEYFHGYCAVCSEPLYDLFGERVLHFDHWIPLSNPQCPGTIPTNMIPLCNKCNQAKTNCHPQEWLKNRYSKRKAAQIIRRIEAYFEAVRK